MRLIFDNKLEMSVIWGPGAYGDNYRADFDIEKNSNVESNTVEIMFCGDWPNNPINAIIGRDIPEDGVVGYIPVEKMIECIKVGQTYVPGKEML
jgi:hypothetical protein